MHELAEIAWFGYTYPRSLSNVALLIQMALYESLVETVLISLRAVSCLTNYWFIYFLVRF